MIIPDSRIAQLAREQNMIRPFVEGDSMTQPSRGLSSFGYDLTLAPLLMLLDGDKERSVDPLNFDRGVLKTVHPDRHDKMWIPPHGFALSHAIEQIEMPDSVMAICVGKSTYARCGLIVNVTPIEPGWKGQITLEITNSTPHHVALYPNAGICQLVFFESDQPPALDYVARSGKYQGQQGITVPRG